MLISHGFVTLISFILWCLIKEGFLFFSPLSKIIVLHSLPVTKILLIILAVELLRTILLKTITESFAFF